MRYFSPKKIQRLYQWTFCCLCLTGSLSAAEEKLPIQKIKNSSPRNVILIVSDDHRYDAMGFMNHPFLKTPEMDRMAREGVHFKNAFVTTSLCSPSRASILTGLYVHNHRVVDNNNPVKPGTVFFSQYLQKIGYQTAFIGKWHMGGSSDAPRPGFDHWVSFRGQGRYYPRPGWTLNVNGNKVPQMGYISDELTDYALEWLNETQKNEKPFCLFLSHKAVHAEFAPAERHKNLYTDAKIPTPITQPNTKENYFLKPMWVKNQRNSWHGVDFPYHSSLDVKEYFREYCRTLSGVDESIGKVRSWLKGKGLDKSTLVIYMGDNGFLFGEHGLIDKRNAYEESMRIPMLATCPDLFPAGRVIEGMVANIDITPTILQAAGIRTPEYMNGRSFLDLASGKLPQKDWRQKLLYEYYWEWNFPQTPTQFCLREDQYKLIVYHGIWDIDELYDIKNDPYERKNLIYKPEHKGRVIRMRKELYEQLESTGGTQIPFGLKRGDGQGLRRISGSKPAEFPERFMREKSGKE